MKIAAFTMAYNEPLFLPLWISYYGRELGMSNLFCIDHGSTDGSANDLPINSIRITRDVFDEEQRCIFVNRFHASLLAYFDAVIFTDCDEFLVPDPAKYTGLRDFVDRNCETILSAIGVNVIQSANDSQLISGEPILRQRQTIRFQGEYCKTLISRIPMNWVPGFHASSLTPIFNKDLLLFHLKYVDREIFRHSHQCRQSVQWSQTSLDKGLGKHWRVATEEMENRHFSLPVLREDSLTAEDLNFESDLLSCALDAPFKKSFSSGTLARVPTRYHEKIPGFLKLPVDLLSIDLLSRRGVAEHIPRDEKLVVTK